MLPINEQLGYDYFGNYVPGGGLSSLGSLFNPISDFNAPSSIQGNPLAVSSTAGAFSTRDQSITLDIGGNLQNALNALNAAGGGTLYLKAGTFVLNASLTGYSSVSIQGVSPSATVLSMGSYSLTYAGTNIYTTGTITSITSGVNVTGSGTTWTAAMAGRTFFLGTRSYVIAAVTSTTTLILAEGYIDNVTLPGASYRITTQITDINISNIQFKSSTGTAVTMADCRRFAFLNCQFISNNIGFTITNCSEITSNQTVVVSSTSDGIQMTNFGRFDWQSTNCISNGGNGFTLNNCKTGAMLACASDNNTSDGFNITTGVDITFLADASGNGGKGVQFVSGCDDCDFLSGRINGNTSDGIKLTASTTNCHFFGLDVTANGGYGINVAVSGDQNNCITTNNFATNTSGAVNDLGTTTVIRGNTGITDNGTSATGQISQSFTAGVAINANDALYLAPDNAIDAHAKNNASATSLTTSITTGNDNTWALLYAADINNNGSTSAGTGVTRRTAADGNGMYDSNAVIHPAGAYSMTTNDNVNESIGHLAVSIIPNGTIAFDAATAGGSVAAGTNITFSHTCTGSNRFLAVGLNINSNVLTATATYNGVSMVASVDSPYDRSTNRMYLFTLVNPTAGANNVVITLSNNGQAWAKSASYTGVAASSFKIFQASSAASGTANGFIGFAQAAAANGASVNATIAGVISGFSGLSVGSQYYLNDTVGTIGTSAGTVTRKVGIAISATQLIVTNIW